jgi:hypothetical protein
LATFDYLVPAARPIVALLRRLGYDAALLVTNPASTRHEPT